MNTLGLALKIGVHSDDFGGLGPTDRLLLLANFPLGVWISNSVDSRLFSFEAISEKQID